MYKKDSMIEVYTAQLEINAYDNIVPYKHDQDAMIMKITDMYFDDIRYIYITTIPKSKSEFIDVLKQYGIIATTKDIEYKNNRLVKIRRSLFKKLPSSLKHAIKHTQHLYIDFDLIDEFKLVLNVESKEGYLKAPGLDEPIRVFLKYDEYERGYMMVFDERYEWTFYKEELSDIMKDWILEHLVYEMPGEIKKTLIRHEWVGWRTVLEDDALNVFVAMVIIDNSLSAVYGGSRFIIEDEEDD